MKCTINNCADLRDLFLMLKKSGDNRKGPEYARRVKMDAHNGMIAFSVFASRDHERDEIPHVFREFEIDGSIEQTGAVVFDLYDFDKVAKKIRKFGGALTFEREDNNWIAVTHDRLDFRIAGSHEDDHPAFPEIGEGPVQTIRAGRLLRVFESCGLAMSADNSRFNLCGLHLTDDLAVATDGHRLRKMEIPGADFGGVTVPADAINVIVYALQKLKIDERTKIEYRRSGLIVEFAFPGGRVCAQAIDQSFPEFSQVLPKEDPDGRATVHAGEFLEALDLVEPFLSPKTKKARLTLDGAELEIYTSSPDFGEGRTTIGVAYGEHRVKAGYNVDYLREAIKDLESDLFTLEIIDTLSPTMIREDGGEPEDLWVIMPMRL